MYPPLSPRVKGVKDNAWLKKGKKRRRRRRVEAVRGGEGGGGEGDMIGWAKKTLRGKRADGGGWSP